VRDSTLSPEQRRADRRGACIKARELLARTDTIYLDTETCGLGEDAQPVSIAVLAPDGTVLLESLINPGRPIPAEATAIHGITDAHVADAPRFADIYPRLLDVVAGKTIVAYNADFDRDDVLYQAVIAMEEARTDVDRAPSAAELGRLRPGWARRERWVCAMKLAAPWYGVEGRWGEYRYQRLEGGDHSAAGDARACLALLRRMAAETAEEVEE
jgi:DNA polymerase III subunit epsilon